MLNDTPTLTGLETPKPRSGAKGVKKAKKPLKKQGETVKLRIGNLAKAVLVSGQAYQDPKDAFNEFVSNAADEYVEGDRRGERVRIVLRRKGQRPFIAVDDLGRGMSPDRLREVARSLFESKKAGDDRTLGEKAIGMLAFQQLGGRCEIVSRAIDSPDTWVLRLERGSANANLEREKRRARQSPGTTVYLSDLDPEVLRVLTQRKVVDYLRSRRSAALAAGDYTIEVIEGQSAELVTPERPEGIRVELGAHQTLWGRIEFALFVAPPSPGKRRRVAIVGRAGTTVIDDLAELEEFAGHPWMSDQVSGQIVFEALQQSAGRRAILRDRDAFPVFLDTIRAIEPAITRVVERITKEVDTATNDRLADQLRKAFSRVLKELADMDSPMRSPTGGEADEDGLFATTSPGTYNTTDTTIDHTVDSAIDNTVDSAADADFGQPPNEPAMNSAPSRPWEPSLPSDLPVAEAPHDEQPAVRARPDRSRPSDLPTVLPNPHPGEMRSRFDPIERVVLYNDVHADYLLVKDDEAALLDYLAILVAKEYVLYNNPRAANDELAEELVRMLVRVRRHLRRR